MDSTPAHAVSRCSERGRCKKGDNSSPYGGPAASEVKSTQKHPSTAPMGVYRLQMSNAPQVLRRQTHTHTHTDYRFSPNIPLRVETRDRNRHCLTYAYCSGRSQHMHTAQFALVTHSQNMPQSQASKLNLTSCPNKLCRTGPHT